MKVVEVPLRRLLHMNPDSKEFEEAIEAADLRRVIVEAMKNSRVPELPLDDVEAEVKE